MLFAIRDRPRAVGCPPSISEGGGKDYLAAAELSHLPTLATVVSTAPGTELV